MSHSYVVRQAKKLIQDGRADEAARVLSNWLRDHPSDTRARDYLAAAYYEMGAYEEALAALDQVIKQWPHKARCWCNYAMVLRKLGRLDEAYDAACEAAELDPDYPKARIELRKIQRLMRLPVCSACGLPVEAVDERACATCGWVYHEWCWEDVKGCINPACGAQRQPRPRGPAAPRSTRRETGCLTVLALAAATAAAVVSAAAR